MVRRPCYDLTLSYPKHVPGVPDLLRIPLALNIPQVTINFFDNLTDSSDTREKFTISARKFGFVTVNRTVHENTTQKCGALAYKACEKRDKTAKYPLFSTPNLADASKYSLSLRILLLPLVRFSDVLPRRIEFDWLWRTSLPQHRFHWSISDWRTQRHSVPTMDSDTTKLASTFLPSQVYNTVPISNGVAWIQVSYSCTDCFSKQ